MFRKDKADPEAGHVDRSYALGWATSARWNPRYQVPRNSLESAYLSYPSASQAEDGPDARRHGKQPAAPRMESYGQNRDWDTMGVVNERHPIGGTEELSDLTHWLGTLGEVYMNVLDNRARSDPRWLNITRRERFEGLASATITIVDYLAGDAAPQKTTIASMKQFADTLQGRPETCEVRVVMVSDLSRFVMGALGQRYSIDPEFWYEYLANSGYGSSDSGLKVKNAAWMNWVERETHFRHHALPGTGQRTEWNVPRRTRHRCWSHLRWGRLGLLNYLGRKGFHEDEIEQRIKDGRWTMERDVVLDKHGLLMTKKRLAHANKKARKRNRRKEREKTNLPQPPGTAPPKTDVTAMRSKTTNVYRPYSTFENLPDNAEYWENRDLRVVAPEGASYWQGPDSNGKKTIILLFDPMRKMEHQGTKEQTPSLTFMPRAMEIESYTDEEHWRQVDPAETFLDPSSPLFSKEELKKQKREAKRQRRAALRRDRKRGKNKGHGAPKESENDNNQGHPGSNVVDYDSVSSYTSDTEYDEDYQAALRYEYENPRWYTRERDYARKYSLSTHDLVFRYMSRTMSTAQIVDDSALLPSILTRLSLDDSWQLLAEIRIDLDHINGHLAAELHLHLLESRGIAIRLNVSWMCSTLHQLHEWLAHLAAASALSHPEDLSAELTEIIADLESLQTRARQTQELLASAAGLAQSSLVIDQTSGINKLTELAFFFIPLSFITSVFSMQVLELTATPPPIWSWGVAIAVVLLVTYFVRVLLRSPTLRSFALECRVLILNRFTSSTPRSASHRLHTVGNWAIAKFLVFFLALVVVVVVALGLAILVYLAVFGGVWLCAAATALYFIVTRWPEPAVLAPCFFALAVAVAGLGACWYWYYELDDWLTPRLVGLMNRAFEALPEKWSVNRVDDDDLANEGVSTYGKRQAILLAPI